MDVALLVTVVVSIGTIVAAIYGIIQFIDWRIERKIHEEPFLRKISASLRPMVIFDENGSILLDQGAMEVLEKIEVLRPAGDGNVPTEILIHPKRHLANAPLLQTLENELIDIAVSRGKGYEWRYQLEYQMFDHVVTEKRRFRLEVLL